MEEVRECAERTLAAESARLALTHHMDPAWPKSKPRRRGGLLRPLLKLAGAAGRRAWEHAGRRYLTFRLEGFVEPSRRRHVAASPSRWSEIHKEGEHWSGRTGQPLATLDPVSGGGFVDTWFLLDALRGLTAATADGEEVVRGTPCRRVATRVDLARASAAVPEGIRPPEVDRFEDLLALPLLVWIDGTYVRRVRLEEAHRSQEVELWDFGVATEELDWSRLPEPQPADTADGAGDGSGWSRAVKLLRRARPSGRRPATPPP